MATSMATADPVVIVGAARTPIGNFQGKLSGMSAPELGAVAIREAVKRSGVPAEAVDEVIFALACLLGRNKRRRGKPRWAEDFPVLPGARR
jgi:acetyl-CoA C-acetyltransferase